MPCGGIVPMKGGGGTVRTKLSPNDGGCWMCHRGGCLHMVIEWDAYIHARCVADFLKTDEGACIIEHGHEVHLNFGLEKPLPVKKENKNDD
jgi:hypothetical protein